MSASRQPCLRAGLAAAVLGVGLMAAPGAHAFTFEDGNGSAASPRQGYLDLDTRPAEETGTPAARLNEDGVTTIRQGGVTVQFGRQPSFNEQYSTERYFDPLGKPPGVR